MTDCSPQSWSIFEIRGILLFVMAFFAIVGLALGYQEGRRTRGAKPKGLMRADEIEDVAKIVCMRANLEMDSWAFSSVEAYNLVERIVAEEITLWLKGRAPEVLER